MNSEETMKFLHVFLPFFIWWCCTLAQDLTHARQGLKCLITSPHHYMLFYWSRKKQSLAQIIQLKCCVWDGFLIFQRGLSENGKYPYPKESYSTQH